jgi:hypothetical protein
MACLGLCRLADRGIIAPKVWLKLCEGQQHYLKLVTMNVVLIRESPIAQPRIV